MPKLDQPEDSPTRIDRYRIVRKLGEGGMGVVYAALDERLDRLVALKMIRSATADERARELLWREARAAAKVSHPNICQLFEIGEEDGELFITMELLEGEPLAERIARGPLTLAEATDIGLAILGALGVLHRSQLVHRDLKPSNIFLTEIGVKLVDFGLARPFQGAAGGTQTSLSVPGLIVGTPQYIAPEQLHGRTADARTDLFAAGAVLFEMLAGRRPFEGATVMDVLHAVMYEMPPVLGGSPAVVAVDRIIHRALAKAPEDRYQSADAMADELRAAMQLADAGEPVQARPMTRLIVLPFRSLRPDPETEFLAYSLPDALTCSLSGLESLVVRSSLTASKFSSDVLDLKAIAGAADVDIVLAGTLLRAGDQVRVSTQLVEAPGGAVLWSQTSQVALGDIFQLQDDLTRRIVDSLALPLTARDHRMLGRDVPSSAKAYEFYLRANRLSEESRQIHLARDLYQQCLADDAQYAPAWARLGRIHRLLALGGEDSEQNLARAQQAFARAFELNPELSLAHNLYTNLEVELGRAEDAMLRLLERARGRPGDAELFAGLVQACRYCGLLEPAIAAYEQAHRMDRNIRTSVNHAYLMLGDYERSIATCRENPPLVNAMALDLMGRTGEAIDLLRRLEQVEVAGIGQLIIAGMRMLLEGDLAAARTTTRSLASQWYFRDPCGRYYLTRLLARVGETGAALDALRATVDGGFVCFSFFTRDPWLDALRTNPTFRAILSKAEARNREARALFLRADGDRVVGIAATV